MRNWPYLHSDDHIYSLPTIREILNRFRDRFRKDRPPDPNEYIYDTPLDTRYPNAICHPPKRGRVGGLAVIIDDAGKRSYRAVTMDDIITDRDDDADTD